MRRTVTLDSDVEHMLRQEMRRTRKTLREALNDALRASLSAGTPRPRRRPFRVHARPLRLRPGIDPASLNRLADDLDAEEFVKQHLRR